MKRIVSALLCCWVYTSAAQTGQSLIANPLLSPNKLKEVKRQIMEAGHQELGPKLAMPVAGASMPPGAMAGQFPGADPMAAPQPALPELVRRALANLRVTAIVGSSALLAPDLPPLPAANVSSQGMPGYAGPQFPGASPMGMAPGMGMQPSQQYGVQQMQNAAAQANPQQLRRGTSTTVRHGRRSYIEGYEVTALVEGDTVRLVMASAPSEIVFQGQVQPASYSPAGDPRPTALEKNNSEYMNNNKPDATSLSPSNGAATANQMPPQNQFPNSGSSYPGTAAANSYPR